MFSPYYSCSAFQLAAVIVQSSRRYYSIQSSFPSSLQYLCLQSAVVLNIILSFDHSWFDYCSPFLFGRGVLYSPHFGVIRSSLLSLPASSTCCQSAVVTCSPHYHPLIWPWSWDSHDKPRSQDSHDPDANLAATRTARLRPKMLQNLLLRHSRILERVLRSPRLLVLCSHALFAGWRF